MDDFRATEWRKALWDGSCLSCSSYPSYSTYINFRGSTCFLVLSGTVGLCTRQTRRGANPGGCRP